MTVSFTKSIERVLQFLLCSFFYVPSSSSLALTLSPFSRQERFKKDQEEELKNHKQLRSNRVIVPHDLKHDVGGHTISEGGRYRDFPSVLTDKMMVIVTAVISLDHYYGLSKWVGQQK